MTCKDCIHYGICRFSYDIDAPIDIFSSDNSRAELQCNDFKNITNYVQLPCKIGDTVWFIGSECTYPDCADETDYCYKHCEKQKKKCIKETKIQQFRILNNKFNSMIDTQAIASSTENMFYFEDVGEKVFFTKEEALAKLKGLKA